EGLLQAFPDQHSPKANHAVVARDRAIRPHVDHYVCHATSSRIHLNSFIFPTTLSGLASQATHTIEFSDTGRRPIESAAEDTTEPGWSRHAPPQAIGSACTTVLRIFPSRFARNQVRPTFAVTCPLLDKSKSHPSHPGAWVDVLQRSDANTM